MNAKHARRSASNAFRASNPTNTTTARTKVSASPAAKMTSLVLAAGLALPTVMPALAHASETPAEGSTTSLSAAADYGNRTAAALIRQDLQNAKTTAELQAVLAAAQNAYNASKAESTKRPNLTTRPTPHRKAHSRPTTTLPQRQLTHEPARTTHSMRKLPARRLLPTNTASSFPKRARPFPQQRPPQPKSNKPTKLP